MTSWKGRLDPGAGSFSGDREDKVTRRRYETAIVACARWEASYVAEWITYHLGLGFDHIYLYCNDDDPRPFKATLDHLPTATRQALSYRPYFGPGLQSAMYVDALRLARQEADWICFLDIDEFIVLKRWRSMAQLVEQLDAEKIDSLHFNWMFYGNNGHVTRPKGAVLSTYTRRSRLMDCHTKHLSRSSCFENWRICAAGFPFWHGLTDPSWDGFVRRNVLGHDMGLLLRAFPVGMQGYLDTVARSDAMLGEGYIAHFALKSEEDFLIRVARGTGGNFGGQIKWAAHWEAGEAPAILATMNEVYDNSLAERFGSSLMELGETRQGQA